MKNFTRFANCFTRFHYCSEKKPYVGVYMLKKENKSDMFDTLKVNIEVKIQ